MSSTTTQPQVPRAEDEAAVWSLYTQLMEGWNRGSGEALGRCGKCLVQRPEHRISCKRSTLAL